MGGEDHGWLNSSELLRDPLKCARIYQEGFWNTLEYAGIRGITTETGRHGVGVRQWGYVATWGRRAIGGGFPWRESGVLLARRWPHSRTRRNRNVMGLHRCNPMTFRCVSTGQAKNPPLWVGFVRAARGFIRRRAFRVRRATMRRGRFRSLGATNQ